MRESDPTVCEGVSSVRVGRGGGVEGEMSVGNGSSGKNSSGAAEEAP